MNIKHTATRYIERIRGLMWWERLDATETLSSGCTMYVVRAHLSPQRVTPLAHRHISKQKLTFTHSKGSKGGTISKGPLSARATAGSYLGQHFLEVVIIYIYYL